MALILDTHAINLSNMPRHAWSVMMVTSAALSICLFLVCSSAHAFGSGPIVPELAPLESAMTNFLAAHQFEAGTLALMHGSKLVFRQGYGWRDFNLTKVIHPDNLYRIQDDHGKRLRYVSDILNQANREVSPAFRRECYRHLGDLTLFNLGLFPESLTYGRQLVITKARR
jgi:hypothetical protein